MWICCCWRAHKTNIFPGSIYMTESCCCTYILPYLYIKNIIFFASSSVRRERFNCLFSSGAKCRKLPAQHNSSSNEEMVSRKKKRRPKMKTKGGEWWCELDEIVSCYKTHKSNGVSERSWSERLSCLTRLCLIDGGCARCLGDDLPLRTLTAYLYKYIVSIYNIQNKYTLCVSVNGVATNMNTLCKWQMYSMILFLACVLKTNTVNLFDAIVIESMRFFFENIRQRFFRSLAFLLFLSICESQTRDAQETRVSHFVAC